MKTLIAILIGLVIGSSCIPVPAIAASITGTPAFTGGEYSWSPTEVANMVILHCSAHITNAFCGLTLSSSSTNYQVPVGKTLRIKYVKGLSTNGTAYGSLCYATATVVSNGTTTVPTGLVRFAGISPINDSAGIFTGFQGPGITSVFGSAVDFSVPTGDFPCIEMVQSAGSMMVDAYGFLQ